MEKVTVKNLLAEEQQMSLVQFYYSLLKNNENVKILDINESPNRVFDLDDFEIISEGGATEWIIDSPTNSFFRDEFLNGTCKFVNIIELNGTDKIK
jgi:hypothetical protein